MRPSLIHAITAIARRILQSEIGNRKSEIPISRPQSAIGNRQSAILLCLLLSCLMSFGDSSPFLIPFQGRLTNPQGVPYTNNQYTIIFNLYDLPVGGTVLWSETHQKVGIINGMVNVFLGSINPTLGTNDFSQTRHLGITIVGPDGNTNAPNPEMVPRQMIIPAFWAKNSEKLAGYDWTQVFGVNSPVGPILGGKIQSNSITAGQIANNTITSLQIANGTLTAQQLAAGVIGSNQIAPGAVTTSAIGDGAVTASQIATNSIGIDRLAPRVVGTNVSLGGVAISASSGTDEVDGVPGEDVINLSVTISTSGRPVFVGLQPDGGAQSFIETGINSGDSAAGIIGFTRDLTVISQHEFGAGFPPSVSSLLLRSPPGAFFYIDTAATAAIHTYTLRTLSNSSYLKFYRMKLVVYEL